MSEINVWTIEQAHEVMNLVFEKFKGDYQTDVKDNIVIIENCNGSETVSIENRIENDPRPTYYIEVSENDPEISEEIKDYIWTLV